MKYKNIDMVKDVEMKTSHVGNGYTDIFVLNKISFMFGLTVMIITCASRSRFAAHFTGRSPRGCSSCSAAHAAVSPPFICNCSVDCELLPCSAATSGRQLQLLGCEACRRPSPCCSLLQRLNAAPG